MGAVAFSVVSLSTTLLDPARRSAAVEALVSVVDSEVKGKGGISGAAIKTAYAAANKLDGSLVRRAVSRMLPEFLTQLDPFWDGRGANPFGTQLADDGDRAAEALLTVTDERAANPKHAAVAKIYGMVRARAKDHVRAALPRVGEALERVAG